MITILPYMERWPAEFAAHGAALRTTDHMLAGSHHGLPLCRLDIYLTEQDKPLRKHTPELLVVMVRNQKYLTPPVLPKCGYLKFVTKWRRARTAGVGQRLQRPSTSTSAC